LGVAFESAEDVAQRKLEEVGTALGSAEELGQRSLENARREADEIAKAGYEELTRLLERFMGMAEQLQDSDAYKAAIAQAHQLAQSDLQSAAREAAQQAGAAAQQLRQSEVVSAVTGKVAQEKVADKDDEDAKSDSLDFDMYEKGK